MKIITKYVLREHLGPLLFALSALTSLLLLNYVAKRFGQLVGKGLEWQTIAEFLLLSLPFTFAMTLPMAVLVSTLYAFSRMAAENEITAFKASGLSVRRLLTPVLWAAALIAVGMVYFNDQILSSANHRLANLQSDIVRKKPTFALRPQVTNRVTERLWLRAGLIDQATGNMRDVIIYDFSDLERVRTVYGDSGTLALTPNQDLALTLYDGVVREFPRGAPGQFASAASDGASPSFQQTFFTEQRVLVRGVGNTLQRTDARGAQIKTDREQSVCELQRSYDLFVRQYQEAHEELVRVAGQRPADGAVEVPARRTTYSRFGLGALYCRMLDRLGVQTANAATPPAMQPPAPAQASLPAATQPPAADSQAATPLPVPQVLPAPSAEAIIPDTLPGGAPIPAGVAGPDAPGGDTVMATEPTAMQRLRGLSDDPGDPVNIVLSSARTRLDQSWQQLNKYDVEIQKKFALAAACIVFVLLGAPIALRFPRGGVGMVLGVSLGVFALYYVGLIGGETIADKGYLPPWAAMWSANIIFTIVGLVLLQRMGREGATARGGDMGELWDAMRRAIPGRRRRRGAGAPSSAPENG